MPVTLILIIDLVCLGRLAYFQMCCPARIRTWVKGSKGLCATTTPPGIGKILGILFIPQFFRRGRFRRLQLFQKLISVGSPTDSKHCFIKKFWVIFIPENLFDIPVLTLTLNTLYLVLLSSLVLIIFSLISNYGNRVSKNKTLNTLSTLSISGYAIPGVILAVAFITFIAWFDDNIVKALGFLSIKKIFIGSILGLVLVYFVRFYSLAFNGIKSGYEKINISVDESSYLLGYSKRKTFMNIHVPFLRNSLLFVGILISLEIIRELPITLILRPFNFETFATTAYISASEDLLEAAAVPSLFLILIATLFIMLTSKYILRENER